MQSPYTNRSYNHQSGSKNKLINVLKRIAELQLRQARHLEKIKYLEAANLRLSNDKQEQLKLMECHPTHQIQALIKTLQNEIKRLSQVSSEKIQQERENWLKKYEQVVQKSSRMVDSQKQKRLELQYQIRILKQSKISNQPNFNATMNTNTALELQNQKLKMQLQEFSEKNKELQTEYIRLQSQIEGKFQLLDQQISLYEKQRQENINKIHRLQEQLKLRQNCDGFSFSNHKQPSGEESQKEDTVQQGMDVNCYKSSIDSLLQQNDRLKKSIMILEEIMRAKQCEIPKQIQIELNLSRRINQ